MRKALATFLYVGYVPGAPGTAASVVAAAVILPAGDAGLAYTLRAVRDSKLLTSRQRDACYRLVRCAATAWSVGSATAQEIDSLGVVEATRRAMGSAIASLGVTPEYLLIDALKLPQVALPQLGIPKGDRDCLSIAAASILAKVSRDRWMVALDSQLPGYGLAQHKGYGTAQHRAALHILGPTCEHRHSFAPIRELEA